MTGGRASRQKGDRLERAIVNALQEAGLASERVPSSGSWGGSYIGDLTCPVLGEDKVFEAKARAFGFAKIYRWLGSHYGLFLHVDRKDTLVVLRLSDFAELALSADKARLRAEATP